MEMIDKHIDMGFAVEDVVSAFERWGIANYDREYFSFNEQDEETMVA
jgi:hypothetical protein